MGMNWLKGAALAVAATASSAGYSAIIVDEVDLSGGLVREGNVRSWTHNINDDGFVLDSAWGASISIDFRDDAGRRDGSERASVLIELDDWILGDDDTWLFDYHNASQDYNTILSFTSILSLNADGFLDVTVKSLQGDFYLESSTLTVATYDVPTVPVTAVPEPGTLALFGLGLAGLGFARRKTNG